MSTTSIFVSSALLASCYSTATLHTARPIAPGAIQSAVAVGGYVGDENGDLEIYPQFEGQIRGGLSERVDAGVHLSGFGVLGFDLNLALLLTETQAVSIDPMIEFSFGTYAWLPVLWDFYHTEDLTLTASLRGGRYWLDLDGSDDSSFLPESLDVDSWLYGGGLAARVQLTDSMAIAPEVRVIWTDPVGGDAGAPILSVSLGLIF